MESACQVKGCKANKKVSKSLAHEEARGHNNNVNCSDDENNEDIKKSNNAKKQHSGKPTTNFSSSLTAANNYHNNNNNNNSNAVNNKNLSSSATHYNKHSNQPGKTSSGELTHNRDVSSYKTATASLPYNKVVSSGKTVLDDCTYDKILAEIKTSLPLTSLIPTTPATPAAKTTTTTPPPTTTTTNNVLSYNQVVINAKDAASSYLGYNKDAPSSYLTYNKVVSGNDDSSKTGNYTEVSDRSLKTNETKTQQQQQALLQQPKANSEGEQRRAVLSYEQVCRLNDVMNEVVSIHGRGNFPTLEVRLRDLVTVVKSKLEEDPSSGGAGMKVRDIRLNGGAATHVLATESQPYNDLDLIFGVELTSGRNYDKVKAAVLCSLFDLLPEGVSRKRITTCSLKEAYVSKMVKVNNDGDRWSLISLGNSRGHRNVELKFVDTMRRQFEFSVDSFQIVLDSLLQFHADSGETTAEISEANQPRIVGESVYGDFHEALYHLQKKLISTRHPEEIRGGGLLKYCNLLVKMYKPAQPEYIKTLERYMCSRFFIDFPDISQQKAKLENYLWNHFVGVEEEALRYQYLMLLHSVVEESTVCLMGHERRQTLALIESLAYQVLFQGQQRLTNHQAPAPAYVYANGYYYAPVIPTACYTCTCNSWMACSS